MENDETTVIELFNYFISQTKNTISQKEIMEKYWVEFSELLKKKPLDYFKIYSFLTKINCKESDQHSIQEKIVSSIHNSVQKAGKIDDFSIFDDKLCTIIDYMKKIRIYDFIRNFNEQGFYDKKIFIPDIGNEPVFNSIAIAMILNTLEYPVKQEFFRIIESNNTRFRKGDQFPTISQEIKQISNINDNKNKLLKILKDDNAIQYLGACLKELIFRYLEDKTIIKDQETIMKRILIGKCQYSDEFLQIIAHITKLSIEVHDLNTEGIQVFEFEVAGKYDKISIFYDEGEFKVFPIIPFEIELKPKDILPISQNSEKLQESSDKITVSRNNENKITNIQENLNSKEIIEEECIPKNSKQNSIDFYQTNFSINSQESKNEIKTMESGNLEKSSKWAEIEAGVYIIDNSPIIPKKEIKEISSEKIILQNALIQEKQINENSSNQKIKKSRLNFEKLSGFSKRWIEGHLENSKELTTKDCRNENECLLIL